MFSINFDLDLYSCKVLQDPAPNDLYHSFDKKTKVDIAILDFSKAFDIVPHQCLLHKLHEYRIKGPIHTWIINFLMQRKMTVVIDGISSDETTVDSGVP